MPGIDELLRVEGGRWRAEVDTHPRTSTAPTRVPSRQPSRRPWSSTRGRVWTVSLAGVAAAAVVVLAVGVGTGSSGSGSGSSDTAGSGAAAAVGRVPDAGKTPASAAAGLAPAASAPASAPVSPTSLVLTGSLELTVRTNDAVDRAATLATGITGGAGGRVDADTRASTGQHSATLVLRVPNAALPGVTRQLAALGTVRSQDLRTRDVTTQVADVNSRVASARAAIAGLTRLYARARTVGELIAVESALSGRQGDLEALEAQQRTLAAQTSLATVTVSIDVRTPVVAHRAHRGGFVGGLHQGRHAFTAALRAIATGLGVALPFLVVVLVAAMVGLVVLRRRRRSTARAIVDPAADA